MRRLLLVLLAFPLWLSAQTQQATLLGRWDDSTLVGSSAYDNTYNEVWGLARNGHEYAIIGSTAGTHFIDVTDPTNPTEAFFVRGAASGPHIIHRHFHDSGDYLYGVCDEGSSTLQIIDISRLPDTVTVVYDSNSEIIRAHNIFIDELNKRLYAFSVTGPRFGYMAMAIFDISDPINPQFLAAHRYFGTFTVNTFHDGFVRDNIAYLNGGTYGFVIADFTNPKQPNVLSVMTDYPHKGYNHSGWLTEDCQYYVMADETWGTDLKMVDVRDFNDIQVVATFDAGSINQHSIPHNQMIACNYLYVSYYYDGLQVYDISNPLQPKRVLSYKTSKKQYRRSYEGAWGVYPFLPSGNILVSDMQEGLFVFEGLGDGCVSNYTHEFCFDLSTSVETLQPEAVGLTVYPQPVQEELNVNISLRKGQTEVNATLFDLNGRAVQRLYQGNLQPGKNQLSLRLPATIPNGMYLLKVENAEWAVAQKVVVAK